MQKYYFNFLVALLGVGLWTSSCSHGPSHCRSLNMQSPLKRARISQTYRPSSNAKHAGVDLAAPKGSPVHAAHSGRIVYAGRKYSGYGKMILLEKNKTWATLYSHMSTIFAKKGDRIKKGDLIGKVGQTGRASGPHLHFELIRYKQPINPLPYILNGCP